MVRTNRNEAETRLGAGLTGPLEAGSHGGVVEISVVMPCLNESSTVGACVRQALTAIRNLGIQGEVIVADNGSTDNSQEIARQCGARVVAVASRGYGSVLLGGIEAARGTFILMGDADESYDFSQLPFFLDKLRQGYDLVVGNRFEGGILPGAMPAMHRYFGNPVLTALGRLFFKSPVGDFHCGLRAFRKQAIEDLGLRTTGMEFASEMVVKASLSGLRMTEVATTLAPDGRDRPPHLRTWHDGWRHLRFLLLFSPRWLFLYPGAALILVGSVVVAWLLPGPRKVGPVVLDVNTLLFASMVILIGYQSVVFAFFTKVFGITTKIMPEDTRMNKLFQFVTLEIGLLASLLLIVGGTAAWGFGLWLWRVHHFGPLDPEQTLRIVIPGVVLFCVGCQTALSSFFLSVMGMSRR
jgi:glycosyltransferase involved in cell wall biosynthesis